MTYYEHVLNVRLWWGRGDSFTDLHPESDTLRIFSCSIAFLLSLELSGAFMINVTKVYSFG